MAWYEDIFVGALSNGVNSSTLVAINAVLGLAFCSMIFLLFASMATNPALVPHVCVLIFLEVGLWIAINWFVQNIGLVDPADQQKELFGPDQQQRPPESKDATDLSTPKDELPSSGSEKKDK